MLIHHRAVLVGVQTPSVGTVDSLHARLNNHEID